MTAERPLSRPFARLTIGMALTMLVLVLGAGTAQAYPGQSFINSPARQCTSTVTSMAGVFGTCSQLPAWQAKAVCFGVAYAVAGGMCYLENPASRPSYQNWNVGYNRHYG